MVKHAWKATQPSSVTPHPIKVSVWGQWCWQEGKRWAPHDHARKRTNMHEHQHEYVVVGIQAKRFAVSWLGWTGVFMCVRSLRSAHYSLLSAECSLISAQCSFISAQRSWVSRAEIGIGLTFFGVMFTILGVVFFFDQGLLSLGNVRPLLWLLNVFILGLLVLESLYNI